MAKSVYYSGRDLMYWWNIQRGSSRCQHSTMGENRRDFKKEYDN